MIINVRGCGGSGKSYVGFKLLQDYGPGTEVRKPYFRTKKDKLLGHVLRGDLALCGRYVMGSSTILEGAGYSGGLDGWHPMDEVQQLVEEFATQHEHVFFESLLISGTFGRWNDFATNQQLLGQEVVFGVMTTTPEVCITRILARNGGKSIDEKDVRKFHRQTLRAALKFEDAGKRVAYLNVRGAYGEVVKILRSDGWRP